MKDINDLTEDIFYTLFAVTYNMSNNIYVLLFMSPVH